MRRCVKCSQEIKNGFVEQDGNLKHRFWCDCPVPTFPAYDYNDIFVSPQAAKDIKDWAKQDKWDRDFVDLAQWWADRKSKDPSTKVGAVIADAENRLVSIGYNGLARGIDDKEERYLNREYKLSTVVHAEVNAILFAGRSVAGCSLFTSPFGPCARCSSQIINAGIKRVVSPRPSKEILSRWGKELEIAEVQFEEAGVLVGYVDDKAFHS